MTPYVLILFKFLGVGLVVKERIVDTLIGSSIALIASYALFPSWEFEQIQDNLKDVICANLNYLIKIAESISGKAWLAPLNISWRERKFLYNQATYRQRSSA